MLETPPKRVRAGFSLAIVTLVATFGSLLLSKLDCLRPHVPTILLGCGVLGMVLLLHQRRKAYAPDVSLNQIRDRAAIENEHPLAFLGNSGYWGQIVIVSTVFLFVVCHFLIAPKEMIIPRPRPKRVITKEFVQPPPPAQATVPETNFPIMKLTGFVCNGTNSTAVINGSTIGMGQGLQGVTLVAVETWGVIVEMNGVKKAIPYGD